MKLSSSPATSRARCKLAALPRTAQFLLAAVAIPILFLASWRSFRAAQADVLESRPVLAAARQALAITPGSARAHDNAAALYAAANPMTAPEAAELRAAVELNPRDSTAWMSLGLISEWNGDTAQAERYFLRAASVDHMFKPAWSLANFYFRTGQQEKFWPWARKCLELVEHRNGERWTFDPRPVFELCWNLTSDGQTIERLAIPGNSFVLGPYIHYLVETDRLHAALGAANRLYSVAKAEDLEWLLALCDTLIQKNEAKEAVRVWNALSAHRLIPFGEVGAKAGHLLTNGDFTAEPSGHGFDWQVDRPAGVYERYEAAAHSIRFEFSGDEPEKCELLGQPALLVPSRRYRLRFRYQTMDMTGTPGLHWSILDSASHETTVLPQLRARDDESSQSVEFAAPNETGLTRLTLRYDREPGNVRPKGLLKISAVTLEPIS